MFSVMIELSDGQFAATLLGTPTIRAVGATRDAALSALHTDLAQRLADRKLAERFVDERGVKTRGELEA